MRVDRVQNIKIVDVIAMADRVIFLGLGVDGLQRTNLFLFDLCHPKTVKIAVCVCRDGRFVIKREGERGCVAGMQKLAVTALVCLEVYIITRFFSFYKFFVIYFLESGFSGNKKQPFNGCFLRIDMIYCLGMSFSLPPI